MRWREQNKNILGTKKKKEKGGGKSRRRNFSKSRVEGGKEKEQKRGEEK